MKPGSTLIGVDLGGTKTAVALYDAVTLERIDGRMTPTDADRGFAAVQEHVLAEIAAFRRPDTVGIGLGVPGFLDPSGTVLSMPNIPGSAGSKPAAWLSEKTKLPVAIDNDARCFAYAEALHGAGKGHAIVLGITLGTGVGGGIVIDGKIFRGSRGYAGEVGHMLLQPGHPPYPTDDRRGDAEQFLSGTAMGKRCEAASSPQDYLEGAVCGFMQPQVFREVAWLVTDVLHVLDPSVIVFGGSAGRALKPHLPVIETELKIWLLPGVVPPLLKIAELPDAAVRGAAMLVR